MSNRHSTTPPPLQDYQPTPPPKHGPPRRPSPSDAMPLDAGRCVVEFGAVAFCFGVLLELGMLTGSVIGLTFVLIRLFFAWQASK